MEENKNILPYIITIYGSLKTESNDIDKMQEELMQTNKQFLISNANEIFIEVDRDEYNKINKDSKTKSVKEKLREVKLITISVAKEKVIKKDIQEINKVLNRLRQDAEKSEKKLMINFDGFDFEKRKMYETEEIRNFVRKLFGHNPDLFYYLTEEEHNSKKILACMAELRNKKDDGDNTVILDFCIPDDITVKIMVGITIACKHDSEKTIKIIDKLFSEELIKE